MLPRTAPPNATFRVLLCCLCCFSLPARNATAAVLYTIKDLGALSANIYGNNVATGLNDSGQVVGHATLDGVGDRAFLYSGGTIHDLGAYPVSGFTQSYPLGINNSGKIVGYVLNSSSQLQGFSSNGVTLSPLGNNIFAAIAINDTGQILAIAQPYSGYYQLVIGSGSLWPIVRLVSGMSPMLIGGPWPAECSNRAGAVAGGESNTTLGAESGAIWYGTASNSPVTDVGVPPGQATSPATTARWAPALSTTGQRRGQDEASRRHFCLKTFDHGSH